MTILVTGGAGYIGSHTVVKIIEAGLKVVIIDNLSNSRSEVINRIEAITKVRPDFIMGDIRDRVFLKGLFRKHSFESVIHFAGLKAVAESELDPIKYYDNNVVGSVTLFEELSKTNTKKIVFSSSATVYGHCKDVEYTETTPVNPINVYGRTKLIVEDFLRDLSKSDNRWSIALLRYFNPVGAHISGMLGEDPEGVPNNLMPLIASVASGKRDSLNVYGGDYPTPDGTCLRDYIHVDDLATGHLHALEKLNSTPGVFALNLGTGFPHSVLEMVRAFETVTGKNVPYEITDRRPGDLAAYYANTDMAKQFLNWEPKLDIERMCADTWRWESQSSLKR